MHDVARSGWRALAVSALLFASATASRAADVVLENLRFQLGEMTYAAPRAEFRGTPHDRAELTALFDPNAAEPLAARIARLQAAEIVLPEILSEFTTPQGPQVTRYRGIVFTQVGGGRIASASAAGGSIDANGPEGKSQGSFGRLALQELDLGLTVAFFTEKATGPAELKRLYGAASVEDLQLTDPSGATTRVGRLFGRDFAARPTAEGWLGTVQVMGQNPDLKAAPPAERARVTAAMADLFGAFQIGALEAIDITFAGKAAEDGKGRIARIAFQGATGSRAAELTLDGFEASSSDTRVQFRSLAFSGLSLQPVLDGLRDFGAAGPDAMSPATMRRFIPLVGATRLTALDVDVPSGAKRLAGLAGLEQPTVRVSVAQFEVLAEKPIEGIPTELRVGLRNLTFPIPANPEDDSLKQLAELGYERVDGSLTTHLGWNEAGQ
ncbi:hypothetical protein, partial [Enterovirga sp.]|uniref:hypothetical protein n=1 Tax=Enterovirga sp. TaxID=2026350 RepID=UPI002611FC39